MVCAFAAFSVFANAQMEDSQIQPGAVPPQINFGVLNGPSGMCFAQMFDYVPYINGVPVNYEVCASPDVILPKLLKNEIDIGILPPNVAAKVFNASNGSIVCAGVSGFGMLNILTSSQNIKSLDQLKGKTLYVAGQGATPEYLLRYLLAQNGIKEGEIELDFSIPANELAAALLSGKIENALMPEPFKTVALANAKQNSKNIYVAVNLQEEWQKIQAKNAENNAILQNYPMTMIVVTRSFAQKYPEYVKDFLILAQNSIAFSVAKPEIAGEMIEKHTLGLKAVVAAKAIPNCAFGFVSAQDAKPQVEQLLSVFLQFAPNSIGGALPAGDFYFK